jgi:phosphoenolpyruvate carboxylase
METRIVIFLAFVSVTLITNTLLIWLTYKAFANVRVKVTETVSQFQANGEMREWISAMQSASEQAVAVTEETKIKMAEIEPVLDRTREQYRQVLANVDSKLDTVANEITTNAAKMRDVVAKPAFSIVTFVGGLARFLENMENE